MSIRLQSRFSLVLPVLAALGLAACAAPPQAKVASSGALTPASYAPANPEIAPQAALPSTPLPLDLTRGPDRFEGLAAADVIAALGDPSFRRRESPAEVWQYYGPGCILDLFLYDDGADAKSAGKVTHAELRGRPGQPVEAACLSRLIDQRHRQRAG